jgi:hypothetical protein
MFEGGCSGIFDFRAVFAASIERRALVLASASSSAARLLWRPASHELQTKVETIHCLCVCFSFCYSYFLFFMSHILQNLCLIVRLCPTKG